MRKLLFIFLILSIRISSQTHYVVTTTNDPANPFSTVMGELRWAIEQANANPGIDYIDFNIPSTPPHIIQLASSLPNIEDAIIMDGNTQPANGYTGNDKRIGIKGDVTTSSIQMILHIRPGAQGNQIKNMKLFETDYAVVFFVNSSNNIFSNNVLHSSNGFGMAVAGNSNNNIFEGNIFGTDFTFSTNSYYNTYGILVDGSDNVFGGLAPGQRNFFYNMPQPQSPLDIQLGIHVKVSGNIFIHNAKNIDIYSNSGCTGNQCKAVPLFQASYSGGTTNIIGTSAPSDFIEVYLSNSGGIDATQLLGTAVTNSSGQWNLSVTGINTGDNVIATATDPQSNTSEFTPPQTVTTATPLCCADFSVTSNANRFCTGKTIQFTAGSGSCNQMPISWNFGDGATTTGSSPSTVSHVFATTGTYSVVATISSVSCTPVSNTFVIVVEDCGPCIPSNIFQNSSSTFCVNKEICYVSNARVCNINNQNDFVWNFGDGTPEVTGCSWCHTFTSTGTFNGSLTVSGAECITTTVIQGYTVTVCEPPLCIDCIESFAPIPTKKYIISAWVKEDNAALTKTSYTFPNLVVKCPSASFTSVSFLPAGAIIDGWQRIEGEFTIPGTASDISIELNCTSPGGNCYFDDVRVFPMDGSMKSYVYDPVTMRLMAELDERNYATLYEYDEEGKLIRVKKETEKGIMTIKENRNNSSK